jgi:hypothetical protein
MGSRRSVLDRYPRRDRSEMDCSGVEEILSFIPTHVVALVAIGARDRHG